MAAPTSCRSEVDVTNQGIASPEALSELRGEMELLERRLETMRGSVERVDELPETMDIVPCTINDVLVGVPLSVIDQVVGIARLSPTRDAPPWIRGLLNLHGVMIPIVDVAVRLAHPPMKMDLGDLILLCSTRHGCMGLWVQSVFSVTRISTATLDRHIPEVIAAPHILGVTVCNGKPTYVLRVDALLGRFEMPGKDA